MATKDESTVPAPVEFFIDNDGWVRCLECKGKASGSRGGNLGDIITRTKHHVCGKPMPTERDIFGEWA